LGADAWGELDGFKMGDDGDERGKWLLGEVMGEKTYEWKSATMALSPSGIGMNSWPAPLMIVSGTGLGDTKEVISMQHSCSNRTRAIVTPGLTVDCLC
jgi:hypothetical protein